MLGIGTTDLLVTRAWEILANKLLPQSRISSCVWCVFVCGGGVAMRFRKLAVRPRVRLLVESFMVVLSRSFGGEDRQDQCFMRVGRVRTDRRLAEGTNACLLLESIEALILQIAQSD